MIAPENPPGFVVRSEARQAAWDNGYRLERGIEGGWMRFIRPLCPATYGSPAPPSTVRGCSRSTTAAPPRYLAQSLAPLPPLLSRDRASPPSCLRHRPDCTPPSTESKLSGSLPDAPLTQFRAKTAALPKSTEAECLVIQRIGQEIFRAALMDYWGARCPLTGIADPDLLRASHIVPWADSTDEQRLDVHNGLLLSALWDSAFDKGLITFADNGQPLASPRLSDAARQVLGLDAAPSLNGLREPHKANLLAHRERNGFELR
jgi:hypothetical protein